MMINKVTLLGHKDHGKSTLIGNLLIQTGSATEQRIRDAKKTSKQLGRKFEPGFILDSFEEEREGGLTIDTTRAQIKYKNEAFEFIDVPGHEELIKNMISGASYADVALLMVSAKKGEGAKPQTKRHLFIAKMLGIKKLVVAVNKMDTVNYNVKNFEDVKDSITSYLRIIGFEAKNIMFVPLSAYNGENLIKKSSKMRWYRKNSLMRTLYNMVRAKKNKTNEDLNVILQGFLTGHDNKISGRITSGSIYEGQRVLIMPKGTAIRITKLFAHGKRKKKASSGENIAFETDRRPSYEIKGAVLCEADSKPLVGDVISGLVFFTKPVKKDIRIKMNGMETKAKKMNIEKMIDPSTGESFKGKIAPLNAAYTKIVLNKKIAFERFNKMPDIGRFVLYDGNKFAGIGIITG